MRFLYRVVSSGLEFKRCERLLWGMKSFAVETVAVEDVLFEIGVIVSILLALALLAAVVLPRAPV